MRAVVWNREYEDDYDDLSSMAPSAKHPREPLPAPPLPESSKWRDAVRPCARARKVASAEICFLLGFACLFGLALLAADNPSPYRIDHAIACLLFAVGALAFGYWGMRLWSEGTIAGQEIRWLALDVGVEGSYPVSVCIYQDGKLTGLDEGVVHFRNDALHFHGLRCDFVLGAQDLNFEAHMKPTPHGYEERVFVRPTLSLRHPSRKVEVVFEPYNKLSRHDHRDCSYRFRKDLRLFLHNWRASHEKSVYPPLEMELQSKPAPSQHAVITR